MYHNCFFIHLSADGHLGCFYALVIINSAAMNIGVHMSLSVLVSSVCMSSSEIAGRTINNLRYADGTTLRAESEEELKSLFDEGKRGKFKKLV